MCSVPATPGGRPARHPRTREGRALRRGPSRRCPGGDLLSHPVAQAVPSALEGLTSGFGMGPGVSPPPWPPKRLLGSGSIRHLWERGPRAELGNCDSEREQGQVLGLLVPVGSTCCHAYTSGLSTSWSARGLTWLPSGRPHLGASFALRCFQRLSLPNVANQPCRWRDNWHTRGSSAPVLSY